MRSERDHSSATQDICLSCALCCNGVIFDDVKLQTGDKAQRLISLGMKLVSQKDGKSAWSGSGTFSPELRLQRFFQPCMALEDCQCRIYSERPKHCRDFQCLLLKSVRSAELSKPEALRIIRRARRMANEVLCLLQELGDDDKHLALATRFRQTARRIQAADCNAEEANLFARLTLAMHDLNLLLSKSFYR